MFLGFTSLSIYHQAQLVVGLLDDQEDLRWISPKGP